MDIKMSDWPENIHSDFEQVQRILLAKSKKIQNEIIDFNDDLKIMRIQGSGKEPYSVTLNNCTCSDFEHRKLPCKHMYALAFRLGILEPGVPKLKKDQTEFIPKVEIEKYRSLYLDGCIKGEDYVNICKAISKIK